jgi:hypothetical protein
MSYLQGKAISRIVVLDTATLLEVRRFDFEDPGEHWQAVACVSCGRS